MSMTASPEPAYSDRLAEAKQFISSHNDFLVVSHVNPDGDAASSTCAVGWLLQQLGKQYTMVNDGEIPEKFRYLTGSDHIVNLKIDSLSNKYEFIIAVDCADYSRLGSATTLLTEQCSILNIDHHPTNDSFGKLNVIHNSAAATVEILYDLIRMFELPLDLEIAKCIYSGLLTDTGGFRYANTTPKVMHIANKLLEFGLKGHELAEHLLEKLSFAHVMILTKALTSLSFSSDRKIAWVSVTVKDITETGALGEDLDGLVNYPRNIEGVEVGILFKQYDQKTVKVSFRSAGLLDVARLAKTMGGGGHVRASGCTVEGSLEDVISRIVELVKKELR